MNNAHNQMSKREKYLLAAYMFLSYGILWSIAIAYLIFPDIMTRCFGKASVYNPLYYIAVYSPSISACVLVFSLFGLQGGKGFLKRTVKWNIGYKPYLFSLVFILGSYFFVRLSEYLFNLPMRDPGYKWYMFIPLALRFLVADAGPIGEELGWRGVLLPLLQKKMSSVPASVVMGFIWATWHLPAFFIVGTNQYGTSPLIFYFFIITYSMLVTQMVNLAQGSILIAVISHWLLNLNTYLNINGDSMYSNITPPIIFIIAAVFINLRYKPKEYTSLFKEYNTLSEHGKQE